MFVSLCTENKYVSLIAPCQKKRIGAVRYCYVYSNLLGNRSIGIKTKEIKYKTIS